eukprot:TRINITY_DN8872_c0_g1_i1.p2 TRINITY_DN8872_c0_g1~~TRINITY_DN8872_c0_g1_i1.p2  ORF type:complete len:215 (+),score=73.14 TRINITY_DN8872_c0_g1_i1:107-751(+)
MGACGSRQDVPRNGQPVRHMSVEEHLKRKPAKSALRKVGGRTVAGEGPPLVILDFDLTLTSMHCGKGSPPNPRKTGVGPIFNVPDGRLQSLRALLHDLKHKAGCKVFVMTYNSFSYVDECLRAADLKGFITGVVSCPSANKGTQILQLCNKYTPSRLVFADDDMRNLDDVSEAVCNAMLLHVTGGQGLQPLQMEWLYYAAIGDWERCDRLSSPK